MNAYDNQRMLIVDYWDERQVKSKFLEKIRTQTFDKIWILTQNEFVYYTIFDEFVFPFLGHYIETKNLNVDLITSIPPESDNGLNFKGINKHYWDTYWLTKTYSILTNHNYVTERKVQEQTSSGLKYHFIMMNNRSHLFRAKLVDIVAREKLFGAGAVSWNNMDSFLMQGYSFRYFDGNVRILDEKYKTPQGGQYSLPNQYFESFAQLISESTPDLIFFSEKISTALLVGKPFLAAAAPGIHRYLHDRLGIQYYDEIFDYSFDDEVDIDKRWEMIVQNFTRLSKLSLSELENLQLRLKDKVEFNKKRAIDIARDPLFMPTPIREYFELFSTKKISTVVNTELCNILITLV